MTSLPLRNVSLERIKRLSKACLDRSTALNGTDVKHKMSCFTAQTDNLQGRLKSELTIG